MNSVALPIFVVIFIMLTCHIEKRVRERPILGMPFEGVAPIKPPRDRFTYEEEDLLPADSYPARGELSPPSPLPAREGRSHPQSPDWSYTEDHRYCSRFVYSSTYRLAHLQQHRERLLITDTPPNIFPSHVDGRYVSHPVPGMVKMVPGIPFVYYIDGNSDAAYTVACLQTLESLQPYPCFPEVLDLSIQLAKLGWGCKAHDKTPDITRLSRIPGLKRNDRSVNVPRDSSSTDGSYSLANTVLKGDGQGTVLPAVQVDTVEARAQIGSVLKVLHDLYRHIMPLCISKFEFEIIDFHSEINNVLSFGGLSPAGTSVQFNNSSLGHILWELIGDQGSWHTDIGDDITRFTLFILLLHVGPSQYQTAFDFDFFKILSMM